jgi:hypothetical protein
MTDELHSSHAEFSAARSRALQALASWLQDKPSPTDIWLELEATHSAIRQLADLGGV